MSLATPREGTIAIRQASSTATTPYHFGDSAASNYGMYVAVGDIFGISAPAHDPRWLRQGMAELIRGEGDFFDLATLEIDDAE
ncbi:MAG: hypothetical protein AAB224_01295 [Gemmatimonadota bacterium]